MTLFNGIAQIKNCKKVIPILTKHLEIRIALTNKISGCETSMIICTPSFRKNIIQTNNYSKSLVKSKIQKILLSDI